MSIPGPSTLISCSDHTTQNKGSPDLRRLMQRKSVYKYEGSGALPQGSTQHKEGS